MEYQKLIVEHLCSYVELRLLDVLPYLRSDWEINSEKWDTCHGDLHSQDTFISLVTLKTEMTSSRHGI